MVKAGLDARADGADVEVPWTQFALINAFNAWKRSPAAGVAADGSVGLAWRGQVCQQVFEEAAADLGRALAAFSASRKGARAGRRVGFPRFKRKGRGRAAFRLRNNHGGIRLGAGGRPRSVRLPGIGVVGVCEDTRRARRCVRPGPDGAPRGRILQATVSRGAARWQVALTVEAPDLHPGMRHPRPGEPGRDGEGHGWVGVDRGLSAFVVAATEDRVEVARIAPPRPLAAALRRLRRAGRAYARTRPGSHRRARAARRLARLHERVANQRRAFHHEVSTRLVKTHDRLVIEDLATAGMVRNRRLARAIADAGWGAFGRMLAYKAGWYGTRLAVAPRWYPSTRRCSACGLLAAPLALAQRTFVCADCGLRADRDANAACNLARWGRQHTQHQVAVERTETVNARGGEGAGRRACGGETGPGEAGTATAAR